MKDYDELIDAWVNGNLGDVADEVLMMRRDEVLCLGALMQKRFGDNEVNRLERMLRVREGVKVKP